MWELAPYYGTPEGTFSSFAPGSCSQIFNRFNVAEHFAGWKFCSREWITPMKSLVHTEELYSRSVPLEQNPTCVSTINHVCALRRNLSMRLGTGCVNAVYSLKWSVGPLLSFHGSLPLLIFSTLTTNSKNLKSITITFHFHGIELVQNMNGCSLNAVPTSFVSLNRIW